MKKEDVKKGSLMSAFSPVAKKFVLAFAATTALATGMGFSQQAEAGGAMETIKEAMRNQIELNGVNASQQVINSVFKGAGLGDEGECINSANQTLGRSGTNSTQSWTQYVKRCTDQKRQYRQQAQAQAEYQRVQTASYNLTNDYNKCAQDRRAEKPTTNYCANVIYKVEGAEGMIILPGGNVTTVSMISSAPGVR